MADASIPKPVLLLALLACAAAGPAAPGRDSVGVFGDWGAFREKDAGGSPVRCYAIAEPPQGTRAAGTGAFAAIGSWPEKRVRAQVSVRLSKTHRGGAPVILAIGDASFLLVANGRDAWPQDRRAGAMIVAAMRSARSMSIASTTPDGNPFADAYRLHGAASAIDAAMLACPLR